VIFPENVQQLAVSDTRGVIIHLDGLGMIADIPVTRCLFPAAGIPDPRTNDAFDNPEPGFDPPESAQTE
jgi:hypothetical protein